MVTLEKYKGPQSRYSCPKCGRGRCFSRYIDTETGEHIHPDCGRCDHESSCGYHLKPRDLGGFSDTPRRNCRTRGHGENRPKRDQPAAQRPTDTIPLESLLFTLGRYDENGLVWFMSDLLPLDGGGVRKAVEDYLIGTVPDFGGAYTCFPYIDLLGNICRGKLIRFDPISGKRGRGQYDTHSLVRKLGTKADFKYKQTFFGEHLLERYPDRIVGVVESEKTAVLCSAFDQVFDGRFVWLAAGSKSWLKPERLARVSPGRAVVLFPDVDGYEEWCGVAKECHRLGLTVTVFNIRERFGPLDESSAKADLADFLVRGQQLLNLENGYGPEDLETIRAEADAVRNEGCGHYRLMDVGAISFP